MAGRHGNHFRGNNHTDGCVALVEHITNRKKCTKSKPQASARRLCYDDQIILFVISSYTVWDRHVEFIFSYIYSVLCQSQTMLVTYNILPTPLFFNVSNL